MLYFGQLKDAAGVDRSELNVAAGATVGSLLRQLAGDTSLPAELLRRSAVAVNREYAQASRALQEGDEVALLPPVSGGSR